MRPTELFETFYNQIGKNTLYNHPHFITELFIAAGSNYFFPEPSKKYPPADYRYKLFNGSKPLSVDIKRSFADGVNVEGLAKYLEKYINLNPDKHCVELMKKFGVKESTPNAYFLTYALALQFKVFIDDKESDEVACIIPESYKRLLMGKKNTPPRFGDVKHTLDTLSGVDKADWLRQTANERISSKDPVAALNFLFQAWSIFTDETGEESNDTTEALEKMKQIYASLNKTQTFEQWLMSAKQGGQKNAE